MQRYAVFFQRVREIAGRLRIAVIEMRGAAENFEVVNSGVADGCEERGRERLMRVHVSGKNAVHPAPWQFDDEPWSVEIGLASIVRRGCHVRNARSTPGQARAANSGSKLPHSIWLRWIVMALPNGYIQERFLDCVSRRFAQKQKRGTLRSE